MSGTGIERLASRMLEQVEANVLPVLPDPDTPTITRLELARSAGLEPDPWQTGVLESDVRKLLLLCCRQAGKSTTSALLALHEACFTPGALVLMLAPSLRQSAELFRKCMLLYKDCDVALPGIVNESTLRAELDNGSRIVALPGTEATTRGYSAATLLIVDEAARVPDELIAAARPTLATTGGRIVALSTPAGKRGWFFLEWSTGVDWERTRIEAKDCPRISKEFLADEERSLGPHVFEQEYNCLFYDPDTAVFSSDLIERALSSHIKPLWPVAA